MIKYNKFFTLYKFYKKTVCKTEIVKKIVKI